MSAATALADTRVDATAQPDQRDNMAIFGFWIYILTDAVLFGSLFAVFAVLRNNSAGGPTLSTLIHPAYALVETLVLLTSSFLCGLGWVAAVRGSKPWTLTAYGATVSCGLGFAVLEYLDFSGLVAHGNSWARSGALSGYFTLLGTHGLHVLFGLLWVSILLVRLCRRSLNKRILKRLALFSIFWHFIDIVWIFIFSVVFLAGGAST